MNNDAGNQKPKFFKPEDFENLSVTKDNLVPAIAAEIANAKLEKLIESWPVVYDGNSGNSILPRETWGLVKYDEKEHTNISSNFTNSRRKARLAFIEPLMREPCKHEPVFSKERVSAMMHNFDDESEFYRAAHCKHCNIELTATWGAK